ncbi:MAG TPA: glycosyltransferase family 1 protein [Methanoculleus sp.]|nr:glycosyltransferase family 1 protein [Methanoculleus sp.]
MNVLVIMKLPDRNMMNHIVPLSQLEEIERIMVVRDTVGPAIDKVEYHCPPSWTLKFLPAAYLLKLGILLRLAREEKPSLLLSFKLYPHGILAFLAGKIAGVCTGVSLIGGPVEVLDTGIPAVETFAYTGGIPPMSKKGVFLLPILRTFDIITVTGNYTRNFLVAHGIPPEKIVVVPHIVENNIHARSREKTYDILTLARLEPVKHIDVLIRAVHRVTASMPGIRVAIVGDGRDRKKLEALTQELGLEDHIMFAGFQQEVEQWFNRSRIFVLTSEREGFPYTVVEAMLCGIPVIASNCGDIADVIADGCNGILIDDYQDVDAFAASIVALLTDPDAMERMHANALKTAASLKSADIPRIWQQALAQNIARDNPC